MDGRDEGTHGRLPTDGEDPESFLSRVTRWLVSLFRHRSPEAPLPTASRREVPAAVGFEGSVLGDRYELGRRLGEAGDAGPVPRFRAYDRVADRWVAVELLSLEPGLRRRFEETAAAHLSLHHPNVLEAHAAGGQGAHRFLVTEAAGVRTVEHWSAAHSVMSPRRAVDLVLEVCAAVHFLHEQGIHHRNLHPGNLFLDAAGSCKIGGLDQALLVEANPSLTSRMLTPAVGFMSPELHENPLYADERADVYGIAAVLYTLVRGGLPSHLFMAGDEHFRGVPSALEDVIRKGSQYQRAARYPTVSDMARELQAACARLPPTPPDTPSLGLEETAVDGPLGIAPRATGSIDVVVISEAEPGADMWRESPIRRERVELADIDEWQTTVLGAIPRARYVGVVPA